MTNVVKFMPRGGNLPEVMKAQAAADGVHLFQIDQMIDVIGGVLGVPSDFEMEHHRSVLNWYEKALGGYEAEHDPQGKAKSERERLVREDFELLCPDIVTIGEDAFEFDDGGFSFRSPVFSDRLLTAVLFYSSPGCAYCVPFAQTLQVLTSEFEEVTFVKVNKELTSKPFDRFMVRALPSLVLFAGQCLSGFSRGAKPVEHMREWLMGHVGPYREYFARQAAERVIEEDSETEQDGTVCIDGVCEVPAKA